MVVNLLVLRHPFGVVVVGELLSLGLGAGNAHRPSGGIGVRTGESHSRKAYADLEISVSGWRAAVAKGDIILKPGDEISEEASARTIRRANQKPFVRLVCWQS